jgi:hypothetical protein
VSDVTRESHLRIQIPVCGEGVTPFVLQLQSLSHYVLGEVYIFTCFAFFSGIAGTVTLDLDLDKSGGVTDTCHSTKQVDLQIMHPVRP